MTRIMVVALTVTLTAAFCSATEDLLIDDFEYPSAEAAQEAWAPDENSEPVGLFERDGGTALRMNADFTNPESGRAVYDRDVSLDLSSWGRFTFDMYIDQPGLFRSFTIYFRSGDGWYGSGAGIGRQGWNRVELSKADFGTEDSPAGWDQIDGVRLSAWRGAEEAGFMAVDNLMAHREPYAIVLGTHTIEKQGGESRSVQRFASTVAGMLADAGIDTSTIGETEVEQGALSDYEFAIFPYNPDMSEAEAAAIQQFVDDGGHLMAFYSLSDGLADVLGIEETGWQAAEDGQLSEIRFENVEEFEGMPTSVSQTSWNLTLAEPGEDAKVIGWWHDADGEHTGLPAFIASDAGVWMSHVLTDSDGITKQRMLVSMMGRYVPEIWPQVAQSAIVGPDQIGHISGIDEATEWIQAHAADAPDPAAVAEAMDEHRAMLAQAKDALEAAEFANAADTASQGWQRLQDAYLLAQVPR
ncbi:MAG: hypothetical protein GF393_09320, partial [Armatimonadia bacterium]|nr:hypothetical protein [Armatimonadia bacterium]